ncbi:metal-dependent hydrolase [Halorussus gelatinilyticus]|uniref:Metal-dependent hydrolase n=1 Tax=Halorussus gelatinilyticus TaxID=2937524 RepID=A0A8U0IJB9_9EURY|nr:metal-dependent hydrolase [Halorussus gelatinilyticus]UPW00392.1 metal-dependent hydrolase [Halorussus gelatinilyticus]
MWPWEHLAVGYLGYSLAVRLAGRGAPRPWPVVALAVGTQFPDLVDKPLAWTFGVLPSGHSLAHSLFAALPLAALAATVGVALDRRRDGDAPGASRVGAAFAFGYLSHLPSDAFYPLLVGGEANYDFLLWPVVPVSSPETGVGFAEMLRTLFSRYVERLARGEVSPYLAVELGLLSAVVALWVADGLPPLRWLWSRVVLGRPVEESG